MKVTGRFYQILPGLTLAALLFGCTGKFGTEKCDGAILDLVMDDPDDPDNKVLSYARTVGFVEIKDTAELMRFAEPSDISFHFQPSELDSTKRKYTLKVKEGIIKMPDYQWDLILREDNDEPGDVLFWLKSYDNDRNEIGHLDFASWRSDGLRLSGRVDCDSTLHMITRNEHRIFRIDEKGDNVLVETIAKEE